MLLHLKKQGPNWPKYPSKGILFFTQVSRKVLTGILTLETHPITYGSLRGTLLRSPFNRVGFPGGSVSKASVCSVGDLDLIPCSWDSPGKNNGVGSHSLPRGSSQPRDHHSILYASCFGKQALCHEYHLGNNKP